MIIDHKCVKCGHPQLWGQPRTHPVLGLTRPTGCGQPPPCACPAGKCQWGEPTTIPRYTLDGTVIAEVVAPGTALPAYTAGSACDCDACNALYTHLTEGTTP